MIFINLKNIDISKKFKYMLFLSYQMKYPTVSLKFLDFLNIMTQFPQSSKQGRHN